ncbi:hypothetical protein ABLE91_01075 [Aquabacter sp. CN5-332]|uniref:hypothetical protein n=1 Tax=Aquabacter sp. CN5-332 TaxID=3156608 RepID=UPI0032B54E8A
MTETAEAEVERPTMDDKLAGTVAEIIELCDGDPIAALSAVYVAYCLLEEEHKKLQRRVSSGFGRSLSSSRLADF